MNSSVTKSIAVLPFTSLSPGLEAEYFADGMTDEIINSLAKIQELKVISRTSSFTFKGTQLKLSEIASQLNVSIILEGSIRLAGTAIRISTQLIEAEEDFHFWSETFDRELNNVFEIQDEISLIIADKLREHIGHFNIDNQLVDRYDVSLDTYQKYLKGRFHLMKLDYENTFKAVDLFTEVIEEAPTFPLPYLDINQGYTFMGTMGIISSYEGYMKAQPFLEKAIEVGPNLPETLLNLSWISCWQKWDLQEAYRYLNEALSIRPSDNMYLTMANYLTLEGKLDTAMKYINKALDLAPFSSTNLNYMGFIYYMKEEYENALPYFKRSLQIQPELPFPVAYIGFSYLLNGQPEEALSYFGQLEDDDNGFLAKLGGITITHAFLGNQEAVNTGIQKLESYLDSPSAGAAMNYLIQCYSQLKKPEKALFHLQQAIEYKFPLVLLLPLEPLAKSLHHHERFNTLMQGILGESLQREPSTKPKNPIYTKEELSLYIDRLTTLMEEDELYLNPDLSLRLLAEYMNLSANQLSHVLNEGVQKNYSHFINSYRLTYFKERLMKADAHQLTILAMAYDSGFNSKTVFNTFFKKEEGITPKAYWKVVNGRQSR